MNAPRLKVTRREQLTTWVAEKYRTHPYFDHCEIVAAKAGPRAPLAYEAGLCHDMLEDGICTAQELEAALADFNYKNKEVRQILTAVHELTDVYTAEAFPGLTKKERRKQEDARLLTINALAQTVKYADLIDNAAWIRQHRPEKWQHYASRKHHLLVQLDKGNPELRQTALDLFRQP